MEAAGSAVSCVGVPPSLCCHICEGIVGLPLSKVQILQDMTR